MKYKILVNKDRYKLMEAVDSHMSLGWKPQGGVALMEEYGTYIRDIEYMQAMVKE